MCSTNAGLRWVHSYLAHCSTTTEDSDKAFINTTFCQAKVAGLALQQSADTNLSGRKIAHFCKAAVSTILTQNCKKKKNKGQILDHSRQSGLSHCSLALNLIRQLSPLSAYSVVLLLPGQEQKYFSGSYVAKLSSFACLTPGFTVKVLKYSPFSASWREASQNKLYMFTPKSTGWMCAVQTFLLLLQ